jgi:4-hydroxy-3-polyprenylbenzoate decarboxylase
LNKPTRWNTFGDFVRYLESIKELKRISVEVDPELEITEIAVRALRSKQPALLFEHVKGSPFPLAINVFASERRIELALDRHPGTIGEELLGAGERLFPPKFSALWKERSTLRRAFSAGTRLVRNAISQEIITQPNLLQLPVLKCWPRDGGRFLTLPQVFTYDPIGGGRNVGMYRMQLFDHEATGMHWQIERGGGAHFHHAAKFGRDLELAVALGTDPALLLTTVAALPEGIDEVLFASFIRGDRIPMVKGKTISIPVPANAEFILEGVVPLNERRLEGPFGDHFGHYSNPAPYPVFHVRAMTHRKNPIFPATVVGIPPMEDKFLGDATQQMLSPLVKLIHKEITDLWAYYEAGFHNLLVVSVDERYRKEAMKTAFGLLGTGQLSLTKCVVLVSGTVDPRNWQAVLHEIKHHFDPHYDFVLINKVPIDTLDFTSRQMELGSKMILDATRKQRLPKEKKEIKINLKTLIASDRRIVDANFLDETLLVVKARGEGKSLLQQLLKKPTLKGIPIIAVVSEDVDIRDQENLIWGIFTRFDCECDVLFTHQELIGVSPVYKGSLGIDATWKRGYPAPLRMSDDIVKLVDRRWNEYGF